MKPRNYSSVSIATKNSHRSKKWKFITNFIIRSFLKWMILKKIVCWSIWIVLSTNPSYFVDCVLLNLNRMSILFSICQEVIVKRSMWPPMTRNNITSRSFDINILHKSEFSYTFIFLYFRIEQPRICTCLVNIFRKIFKYLNEKFTFFLI